MPTTKPRHAITETEPVAAALEAAGRRWPEDRDNRGRLLLHLIEQGHQAITAQEQRRTRRRIAAVERTHGALRGAFGHDYLDELREDWPK